MRLLGKLFQAKFIRESGLCKERAEPSLMNVTVGVRQVCGSGEGSCAAF